MQKGSNHAVEAFFGLKNVKMQAVLLSSAYFGPIQWFQKLSRHENCLVERFDHFQKQTYRNRCVIMTANGRQTLTVPVEHVAGMALMRDVRISDHGNWRHLHWNALRAAYGETPFFDYYADDIHPFFERKYNFLYDFNFEITQVLCTLLDIHPNLKPTENFAPKGSCCPLTAADLRETIHPKHPLPDDEFRPRRYWQIHEQKHGFQPNLSILDLLFNQGNESIFYL